MGVSFDEFARELRAFDNKREVVNEIRREMRKPLPALRKAFRANALATLPARGGFGAWVAKARITAVFKDSGRAAGVRIKVSRKAGDGDKAELDALDESGSIRHPLYGHRGHWYGQKVAVGVFTKVFARGAWISRADAALDRALDKIRRG